MYNDLTKNMYKKLEIKKFKKQKKSKCEKQPYRTFNKNKTLKIKNQYVK